MATLPQLIEEDVRQIEDFLQELLEKSDATTAVLIDKGGFLIAHHGDSRQFDLTTIAALSAGAFMANETIAGLVQETNFSSVYQQGEKFSVYIQNVDEYCVLLVVFKAHLSVGAVKYYAAPACNLIAQQLQTAAQRDPDGGLDLSMLNLANPSQVFRKK